ncbi:MAG: metallophosphoesterase [archaeon]
MRILAIGDYAGKLPEKFKNIVQKEKIDLVLSNGDYCPFSLRKLYFKYAYKKDVDFLKIIGKKKYKESALRDISKGEEIVKKLNKFSVPVFSVLGNNDYPANDVVDMKKSWKFEWDILKNFEKVFKKYKNVKRIDYTYVKFGGYIFIGARGHSYPGRVKSKAYKKHRKILEKLFRKFRKENKERRVIFLSHNVPYDTKLDIIKGLEAHEKARGKHYGSKLIRRIIDKYHPVLHIAGHIDEGRGKQKLGRTLAINCGPADKGYGVIIDINKKGKIKTKFLR